MHVRTSARGRATSWWYGQLTWQLQCMKYSLPGTAVYTTLGATACQEHQQVASGPVLLGMGSLDGWAGALAAAHPGAGVGAVQGSREVPRY